MNQEDYLENIDVVVEAVRRALRMPLRASSGPSYRETSMRYRLIDPILWSLGWNTWVPRECEPELDLGQRGLVDYALFDENGGIAVFIVVRSSHLRRRSALFRLRRNAQRAKRGVGVLICGPTWEIYDLGRRVRTFAAKRVDTLLVAPDVGDDPEYVAEILLRWIGKGRWWQTDIEPEPES